MDRILFAWIGHTDLQLSVSESSGPIATAITNESFAKIVLLNNYPATEQIENYLAWLRMLTTAPVSINEVELDDPTDLNSIYEASRKNVETEIKNSIKAIPVFHLSPGTPSMAVVWILLSKGLFQRAELIKSSKQQGVEQVNLPFNISAEYIPDKLKGDDRQLISLAAAEPNDPAFGDIVYQCPAMQQVVTQAQLAAVRDVPVLIEGETGTGKELFAKAIHKKSKRSKGPFVAVNCGAIPRELFESEFFGHKKGAFTGADSEHAGYFEQAHRGTLFLDELGELPLDAQVKILRVINDGQVRRVGDKQERSIDVRIITATNRSLIHEVAKGNFRSDLFYRFAVAVLNLPPLRKRHGDIDLLVESMLSQVNAKLGNDEEYKYKKFSANAKNIMLNHSWPGNAREMVNTITRICVWAQKVIIDEVDVESALLPSMHQESEMVQHNISDESFNLQEILDKTAKGYIKEALEQSQGNKTKAASLLGLKNYQNLSNWMKKLDITT